MATKNRKIFWKRNGQLMLLDPSDRLNRLTGIDDAKASTTRCVTSVMPVTGGGKTLIEVTRGGSARGMA